MRKLVCLRYMRSWGAMGYIRGKARMQRIRCAGKHIAYGFLAL